MAMIADTWLHDANRAFQAGRAGDALAILHRLPEEVRRDANAILLEGLIHEFGGRDVEPDLAKALRCYQMVATLAPEVTLPCLYIARVLMKTEGTNPTLVRRWLSDASRIRHDADVDLAYAAFYEEGAQIDLDRALACFRRAAFSGRYAGFFGISRILRKRGKRVSALAVDCLRILLAPILLMLFGKRVTASFNGYWS